MQSTPTVGGSARGRQPPLRGALETLRSCGKLKEAMSSSSQQFSALLRRCCCTDSPGLNLRAWTSKTTGDLRGGAKAGSPVCWGTPSCGHPALG
eukprot:9990340-Alexandrium_andersonii.AAC.1